MTNRIAPTPEDTEIFQRHIRRIIRWDRQARNLPEPRRSLDDFNLLPAMRRSMADYTEFKAFDSSVVIERVL